MLVYPWLQVRRWQKSRTGRQSRAYPTKARIHPTAGLQHGGYERVSVAPIKTAKWASAIVFSKRTFLHPGPLTTSDILELVQTGKLFGILRADIETPEHLKEMFSEMCPNIQKCRHQSGWCWPLRETIWRRAWVYETSSTVFHQQLLWSWSFAHHPSLAILSEAGLKSHPYLRSSAVWKKAMLQRLCRSSDSSSPRSRSWSKEKSNCWVHENIRKF